MNRGDFFKTLGLGIAGLSAAANPQAKANISLCSCHVAGVKFHEGINFLDQIKNWDSIDLVREKDNLHDSYAVSVHWQGKMIGYVPRDQNKLVAQLLDNSIQVKGLILFADPNDKPWNSVWMHLFMEKELAAA